MKTFIYDTETTGLIQNSAQPLDKQPHIIELSGTLIEGENILEEIDFLCNPGIEICSEITKITGLKNEDLKGQKKFKDHWNNLIRIFQMADEIVAHNLSFDNGMVSLEAQRMKVEVPWPGIKICTVEATEFLKGRRLSLQELHEHLFGEGFTGAHRAKNDVQALVRCFIELRKKGDV